jgi:hypothetical protein
MARRLRYLPLAVVTAISFVVVAGGYAGEALRPPTSEELRRLLPELRNPRIFTEADLKNDDERQAFRDDGLSFILRGDVMLQRTGPRDARTPPLSINVRRTQ